MQTGIIFGNIALLVFILFYNVLLVAGDHPYGVKIYTMGEAKLREPCEELTISEILSSERVKSAVDDAHLALNKFRTKMGFGRAIAAPQVGHSMKFVAMNLQGKRMTLFNPVITKRSEETFTMWDDCLSFPDLMCCVRRHRTVSVQFLNEAGEQCNWDDCSQDISELLQHEIDHIEGILAVDRAESPNKDSLKKMEGIVSREGWLQRRTFYNSLVDFAY